MLYLQMNALKQTIKIIVLPSFSRHKLKLLSKCCIFKVCQYINSFENSMKPDINSIVNSVDPDQLASEEAS